MSETINAALRADDARRCRDRFRRPRSSSTVWTWTSLYQPFGEERTDGTVGETAGEDFLLGRTAFALEVTAGKLAGGGGAFRGSRR
jgi:hypothetical protein